jgi:Leucine-rich repeat (LRR) protein
MNLKRHRYFTPLIGLAAFSWLSFAQAATDCAVQTQIDKNECKALVELYIKTGGANWKNNTGWNVTDEPCGWYGVTCEAGEVTELEETELEETDQPDDVPIPDDSSLEETSDASIAESSLESLSKLTHLELSNNQLNGFIPESLGDLINLTYLDLSSNQISGSIPESLGNLSNLQSLYLYVNQLNGSIPESLGNLENLQIFDMHDNQLSGSIPQSLGNLSSLQYLYLHDNKLSDSIPGSLGFLRNLEKLYLNNNQLSDSIPGSLGMLSNLQYLYLNNNQLSDSIPGSLGNLKNLVMLRLDNNQLSRSIPYELGNLSNLMILRLDNNQLCESIPYSLGRLNKLRWFHINDNELCGDIPNSLKQLNKLNQVGGFMLKNNHLTADKNAYQPEMIAWLDKLEPDWATTQTRGCPLIYGVHDEGLNDSQFFRIDDDFEVKALGSTYSGYDIEGLDMHPETGVLYATSGDNSEIISSDDFENGAIYTFDKYDGTLTHICRTGLGDLSAIAFHPRDDSFWGWAKGEGLFTINLNQIKDGVCAKTAKYLNSSAEVEAIAWDSQGDKLYGTSKNGKLYQYKNGVVTETCHIYLGAEALDTVVLDGEEFLLYAANGRNTSIRLFDVETCSKIKDVTLPVPEYNDIEGITFNMP